MTPGDVSSVLVVIDSTVRLAAAPLAGFDGDVGVEAPPHADNTIASNPARLGRLMNPVPMSLSNDSPVPPLQWNRDNRRTAQPAQS
jgi:hypothetical protein